MSLSVVGRMRLIIAAFLVLSVALGGLTWALTVRIGAAQAELARTSMVQGYLERINGLVYAVVMDSRGVYMAKTPEQVDRFGKGLEGFLGKIGEARQAIETAMGSDRPPAYAEFARQLEAFTRLRLELVAAGRKEGAEAARVIGDNEANRATRMAFNKAIDALAEFERTKMAEGQAALQSEIALYRTILAACALLMVAGGIGCWFWLARSVGTPLSDVLGTVRALASGDLSVASRHAGRKDEIGALAGALETFRSEMAERAALEGTARAEATARDRRARTVAEAIAAFDRAADAGTQAMARASGDLHSAALTMSSAAEQTRQQVGVVADASGLVTDNIHALARTGEELAGAVAEIAHRVSDASGVAAAASGAAQATSSKVRELSEAAATIGGIIDLINSIAAQTNLLALNATIEAARAGDAGRGFAIVAAEVKQLAAQTTKATDEITSTVGRVQAVTEEVIGAIQEIEGRIADVSGLSTSVAAAVEEQRASTEEIAQSVRMAATGAQQVTGNIAGVNEAATSTGDVALKVLASAQALSEQSTAFRAEIDRFLQTVRAA